MLASMGLVSLEDLYAHLPQTAKLNRPLAIPSGQSEYEIIDYFRRRSEENANSYASFWGREFIGTIGPWSSTPSLPAESS